jgi:hypothetical protein
MFNPKIIPDNIARAFVIESFVLDRKDYGGKDMFGVEWEYVEVATGSMVKPGSPILKDANEWEDKLIFPDIDKWDWKGSAESNRSTLKNGTALFSHFFLQVFMKGLSHLWILTMRL